MSRLEGEPTELIRHDPGVEGHQVDEEVEQWIRGRFSTLDSIKAMDRERRRMRRVIDQVYGETRSHELLLDPNDPECVEELGLSPEQKDLLERVVHPFGPDGPTIALYDPRFAELSPTEKTGLLEGVASILELPSFVELFNQQTRSGP